MYTLYYYNEAFNISTIEIETLTQPVRCPENLFFIALRKGKTFITEPHECIKFSPLERLYIRSFGLTSFAFKNENNTNFRNQNTYLDASTCAEGDDGEEEKCPCNCDEETPVESDPLVLVWFDGSTHLDANNAYGKMIIPDNSEGTKVVQTRVSNGSILNLGNAPVGEFDVHMQYAETYEYVLKKISDDTIVSNTITARRFVSISLSVYSGSRVCADGVVNYTPDGLGLDTFYSSKSDLASISPGDYLYTDYKCNEVKNVTKFLAYSEFYLEVVNGQITEKIYTGTPCAMLYSYKRDGSQMEGNALFHIPTVEYTDENGNPQVFYADMTSDACGSFYALSIENVNYCFDCND